MYDSTQDIINHKEKVSKLMLHIAIKLLERSMNHDNSNFNKDEKDYLDRYNPILKIITRENSEYDNIIKSTKKLRDIHYSKNDHHIEYFNNGLCDMNIFQIIEMFCDLNSYFKNEKEYTYIKINQIQKTHNLNKQLKCVFENTFEKINNQEIYNKPLSYFIFKIIEICNNYDIFPKT